jgi:rhodanese-related sulfurtransferase
MRRWAIATIGLVAAGAVVMLVRMRAASADAHEMVAQGGVLLDVRSPEEFAAGHLPGAINIPVGEVRARASEIGTRDRPVVTYCRSGGRSARAAATLRELGFERVLNLGPKAAW